MYLQYAPSSAVRVVVQEMCWKPQSLTQPVQDIHLQLCAGRAGCLLTLTILEINNILFSLWMQEKKHVGI